MGSGHYCDLDNVERRAAARYRMLSSVAGNQLPRRPVTAHGRQNLAELAEGLLRTVDDEAFARRAVRLARVVAIDGDLELHHVLAHPAHVVSDRGAEVVDEGRAGTPAATAFLQAFKASRHGDFPVRTGIGRAQSWN